MKVEQIYTGCLAEAAYYIMSNGEAVVIDPLRETTPYTKRLEADKATLKYIFLTHFHADFVSGHLDLAKKTGATIVFGPTAETGFDFHSGADNEEFLIGDVKLKLIHTPGHTLESSCYLLYDKNNKELVVHVPAENFGKKLIAVGTATFYLNRLIYISIHVNQSQYLLIKFKRF